MVLKQIKSDILNSSLFFYFKPFFGFLTGDIFIYLMDLLIFTLIARMVGTEGYGYLSRGTATTIWLEILVIFGFNIIGATWVASNPDRIIYILKKILFFRLVAVTFLSIGLGVFSTLWIADPVYRQILIARIIILIGTAFNLDYVFIGQGRPLPFVVTNLLWRLTYLSLLFVIFTSRADFSLFWFPLSNGLIMVAFNLILVMYTLRFILRNVPQVSSEFRLNLKQMIQQGAPVTFSNMSNKGYNLNVLLLTIWATTAEVGFYAAATRILNVLLFVLVALLRTFGPRLAVISKAKDQIHFDRAFNRYKTLCSIIGVVGALGIFLTAKPAVLLILDKSFANAATVLQIYSLYFLVIALHTPYSSALPFIGEENKFFLSNLTGLGTNLVSNLVLIPSFGYVGASFAAIIGGFAILMFAYLSFRRWYDRFNWSSPTLELGTCQFGGEV